MRQRQASDTPDHYADLHGRFGWQVPRRFNMAAVCSRRWAADPATAQQTAVIATAPGQPDRHHSYAELQRQANRLSSALAALGVRRGDRVAIVMPQRFETAVAYMAVLQMGAVGMPLSQLFGPEALAFRLQDSEAVVAICDGSTLAAVQSVSGNCPQLRALIAVEAPAPGALDWTGLLASAPTRFKAVDTLADEAAVLIYTSGTTGNPKGALIPHRALIGNLTGFVCSQNWFGFDPFDASKPSQAVFWSPADWAWTGGLMDALLPSLYFGRPIVAFNGRFSPQAAFELMERHGVTHTFLFPTALKAMMKAYPQPRKQFRVQLQAIMSAGEAVGDAVFAYCRKQLGVTVNEMFGQTEINYIVGNCARLYPAKPGSMGKGYPGHRVAVIDDEGHECPVGVPGDVAVHRLDVHGDPDPIFFLGYWKNEAATRAKFTGDMASSWCRTGDMAVRDAEGYLWYQGRADDVFKAAGYRIGPGEIENCLVKHPAVANAAVVPKPDAERGAVVKAYVVLAQEYLAAQPGRAAGDAAFEQRLVAELQAHVKGKLAPYEYPKEIEFVESLPMTTTGKVQRRVLRLQEEARARALA
ncbi:MAG: AMP-binding protein [Gammaproteobacteria bacterium]|uniref:acyl-CoA synthetase n=1 Tax=Hydrogenophaga sp. TaxID=1904254 RepID=UPI0025C4EC84|nr:AMP-binding protein [Hydrogenophaga sp.]MBU4181902.1 AMP-binding protein [Gammaproteobacteria bacterium]MBU4280106.1 AMP-binding protein [Gammaproteobacteria bacterium]MBU4504858.1 AMP-binding protein [Gammaproteobacteria bacterium]MCG2655363.1 AMP-binding protein [Hydrogenophaga sp.]